MSILGLFAFFLAVAGCDEPVERPFRAPGAGGKLVFVTKPTDPPYTYIDEKTRDYAGVEVEIARAAAKKLGLELEIRSLAFQDLLPSVKSGKADYASDLLTITPARAKNVNFSCPYANDGSAFLHRTGSPVPSLRRAKDLRIGTEMVSTCYFYLCDHDIDPFCYDDYALACAEFKKGNLDAVFYDAAAIRETVRTSNGAFSMSPLENRENYGIAVRKDYPELLEAVNQAIAERSAE